jgi:hypothetical protein
MMTTAPTVSVLTTAPIPAPVALVTIGPAALWLNVVPQMTVDGAALLLWAAAQPVISAMQPNAIARDLI